MNQKLGLSKYAQTGEEFVQPEQREKETLITCLSDCMYAQNPEKTCMLTNVSFAMSKSGQFACGQYAPVQQAMPQEQTQQPAQKPGKPAPKQTLSKGK